MIFQFYRKPLPVVKTIPGFEPKTEFHAGFSIHNRIALIEGRPNPNVVNTNRFE
jgi:hypothetical protein